RLSAPGGHVRTHPEDAARALRRCRAGGEPPHPPRCVQGALPARRRPAGRRVQLSSLRAMTADGGLDAIAAQFANAAVPFSDPEGVAARASATPMGMYAERA